MQKIPTQEAIPAWYGLGVRNPKTLVISIHDAAFAELCSINFDQAPAVRDYQEKFTLGRFAPPTEPAWGFNGCLRSTAAADDWHTIECALPVIHDERQTEKYAWAYDIRSTLSILFTGLWLFDGDTGWPQPQLMVVEGLRVDTDLYGGALQVSLTPAMCQWLAKQPHESSLTEVEDAMQKADAHMWHERSSRRSRHFLGIGFRAHCRQPKWINFTVPGNACGLDPSDYYNKSLDTGYLLSPHNTDTSLQQLTLLMGLAKLHDLAR